MNRSLFFQAPVFFSALVKNLFFHFPGSQKPDLILVFAYSFEPVEPPDIFDLQNNIFQFTCFALWKSRVGLLYFL